jgi:hypothetical protein
VIAKIAYTQRSPRSIQLPHWGWPVPLYAWSLRSQRTLRQHSMHENRRHGKLKPRSTPTGASYTRHMRYIACDLCVADLRDGEERNTVSSWKSFWRTLMRMTGAASHCDYHVVRTEQGTTC